MKIVSSVHDLIIELKNNPEKIYLSNNLYDWLVLSNWDYLLSDRLKEYMQKGGIVERCVNDV